VNGGLNEVGIFMNKDDKGEVFELKYWFETSDNGK